MDNKLVGLILAITVGIIMAGALLVPFVQDAQRTVGDEVTVSNTLQTETPTYNIWSGEDIEFTFVYTTGVYTVDGTEYDYNTTVRHILLASNDFTYRNGGDEEAMILTQYIGDTEQVSNQDFTFTVSDGEYTLVRGTDTLTGTVDWLVYAVEDGTSNLGALPTGGSFVTGYDDDFVVLGSIYTTGDNDTFYSYYDGDLTVNSTYESESSVSVSKTLKDGYADIYDTTVTVTIGDETFTPYYILVPISVDGHETGSAYSILGVVPVIVILALMMMMVPYISKRDD